MQKVKKIFAGLFAKSEFGVIVTIVLMCVIISVVNPNFLSLENVNDLLRNTSYSFIIAAPLTLLLMSGSSDMTIGAVTSLGGIVCALCLRAGTGIIPALLATCLVGALWGIFKSYFVVSLGLTPFITTLGLTYVLDGAILVYTEGNPIVGLPESFKVLGQGRMGGTVYWTIVIAFLFAVAFYILQSKSRFGREVRAVGGNTETARLAGINVAKTRYLVGILVSVASAFAGALYCSRFNSAQPTIGTGTNLTIMAACIIGGASMGGGSGSLVGSFLGVFMIAVIKNGLVLMHVSSYWQNFMFGAVLVASLYVDKIRRSRSGGGQ